VEPGSNGLAFHKQLNGLIVCEHGRRQVVFYDSQMKKTVLASRFRGRRLNSPNDVTVADNGDIYFTDPPYGTHPNALLIEQ
jgi:gluconolactonase